MESRITEAFRESIEVKEAFLRDHLSAFIEAVEVVTASLRQGGKLLIFGNGGSAADAQHIAAEIVNRFLINRRALPAVALTTDTSILTSVANDFDFSEVFSRQVEALGRAGDVAIAISTSGGSPNVNRGIEAAREAGMTSIALTGGDGGEAARLADLVLNVSSTTTTARIQETHITVAHILCELVEENLCEPPIAEKPAGGPE